ncbi:MAG: glycosyltransferase, partial [Eubacterium sp.]|nr:glycosyltransferase [Eubacterium sp.]
YGAKYINQEEPAFAGAFKTGIKYAKMDKFLILDSDGSHDPAYIMPIYEMFVKGQYDVVIGSRYVKGGKTNDAKTSIIMSHILNGIFKFCLNIKAKDISTDYRMYHTNQLKNVSLSCHNYDVLQEVLLRLRLNNSNKKLSIGEVPIEFKKRIYGESKRRLLPFILSYIRTLCKLTFLRFHER